MAVSIFNTILNWTANNTYKKYDRVKYNKFVYYSLTDHSSSSIVPESDFKNWGGVMKDPFGTALQETSEQKRPHFFFSPSYGITTTIEPKAMILKFGDGYEQRVQDGINNSLLKIDLSFDLRPAAESAAIVHFLNSRAGVESFLFTPVEPYATLRNFVCKSWSHTLIFYENNSIRASFEQVPF